ncbi:hypothetical protein, partial [Methylomagnum sp.]
EQGQNLQRLFGKTQHRLASPIHCLGQPLSYASRLPLSANVKMAKVELARWFAIALGHQIAEGLEIILRHPVEFINQSWTYDHYGIVRIAPLLAEEARVHRKNSLFSFRFGRLKAGDTLQVDVPPGTSINGICANFGGSAGIMKLTGQSEMLIDTRNGYQRQDRPLFSLFIVLTLALQKPILEMDGRLNIEIVPLRDIPKHELGTIFHISPCHTPPPDLGTIELGSLILKGRKAKTIERMPAPRLYIDLANITKSIALEAAVDIFLSHGVSFPKPEPT